jgi:hypothetical protein
VLTVPGWQVLPRRWANRGLGALPCGPALLRWGWGGVCYAAGPQLPVCRNLHFHSGPVPSRFLLRSRHSHA